MIQPLALVLYEKLMPGSQVANRLQDLNYRVVTVADPGQLLACAVAEAPMLVLADLESSHADVCALISGLRKNPATAHIPVIAFVQESSGELTKAAQEAGATLVVESSAILNHLPHCLEQALRVE